MLLVQLRIEVDFAKKVSEYSLAQKVHKEITGKTPKEVEPLGEEKTVIRSPKRKLAVRWNNESFGVVLEQAPKIDDFVKKVINLADRINTVAPIGKMSRRQFITHWLLPAPNYDFTALERKYRETMIVQKSLYQGVVDSGVILDASIGDDMLHHQSGPMDIPQLLNDYLFFKSNDVPKFFLFLWASIIEQKMIQYSSEEMQNYLVRSFSQCKSHSDSFERIWEGIL